MRVLLPPSETKRPDGGNVMFRPASLAQHTLLDAPRTRVRAALVELSRDEPAALRALKLGAKSKDERLHNLRLDEARGLEAARRYTGVLYDALDTDTLDASALRWLGRHVFVQSSLFGLISSADEIPPYRLSATTRLPGLGSTLTSLWSNAHDEWWGDARFVIDLRSKDYAALAPIPASVPSVVVEVVSPGADGVMRALNHFNKRAKGLMVRALAETLGAGTAMIHTPAELLAWGKRAGLDLRADNDAGIVLLVTTEGAPSAPPVAGV